MCLCNSTPMTSEHLLQHYPRQDTLRKTACPGDPPLTETLYGVLAGRPGSPREDGSVCERIWSFRLTQKMLYGDLAAIKRTAAFVRGAGVSV